MRVTMITSINNEALKKQNKGVSNPSYNKNFGLKLPASKGVKLNVHWTSLFSKMDGVKNFLEVLKGKNWQKIGEEFDVTVSPTPLLSQALLRINHKLNKMEGFFGRHFGFERPRYMMVGIDRKKVLGIKQIDSLNQTSNLPDIGAITPDDVAKAWEEDKYRLFLGFLIKKTK